MKKQAQYYSLLYDLALATSGENRVLPLLTKAVQRFMYHTGFPCGMFVQRVNKIFDDSKSTQLCFIELMVCKSDEFPGQGDYADLENDFFKAEIGLVNPKTIFGLETGFEAALRIPTKGDGVFILLTNAPVNNMPYAQLFQPIIDNFSNNLRLCRASEADTKQLRKELLNSKLTEAKLRLADRVVNYSNQAILVIGADNEILQVNPAFSEITGYEAESMLGKSPASLLSQCHNKAFFKNMLRTLLRTGSWQGELFCLHKRGRLYATWQNISVVRNEKGKIIQWISMFSDISDQKRAEDRIKRLAHYDQLTGLPNRLLFVDRLEHAITRARRSGNKVGLMFIDLDQFKSVNDTLGHQAGDELLKIASKRLAGCVRAQDTVSRLGGDEFTVILEDLNDEQGAMVVADKIIAVLSQTLRVLDCDVKVGASIGITLYPDDGMTVDAMIKNSDLAMYQAKANGRSCYQFYSLDYTRAAEKRFRMETELQRAIDKHELVLHYQPQINMATQSVEGCEALVRWEHPTDGLIFPDEFIPFAEERGLIGALDAWVLRAACEQAASWQSSFGFPIRVSVNLSARHITEFGIVELVRNTLEQTGLEPGNLELEVTEGFVLRDIDKGIHNLRQLRKMGVQIALDDFGTGYSSLRYLKSLPVDRLKIDRSFIADVLDNRDDAALVKAIVNLAAQFGLSTIAEGVESEEHVDFLLQYGCLYAQGYFYSKPLGAEQFIEYVQSTPPAQAPDLKLASQWA
ncbi:MAG: EAL domain-containing protein [Gammaproteobacteria bacterium]|nr:EAL domain-containing protein [Gammaproteobacteria bacterium]MDH5799617.1 EAL domain-containing protein [Gammaproteobacteria bacterium]